MSMKCIVLCTILLFSVYGVSANSDNHPPPTCPNTLAGSPFAAGTRIDIQGPATGPAGTPVTWTWSVTAPLGTTLYKDNLALTENDYKQRDLVFDAVQGTYSISLIVRSTNFPDSCMDEQCISFVVNPPTCPLCTKTFCESAPMIAGSGTCVDGNPSVFTYPPPINGLKFKWYWGSTPITGATTSSLSINWANGVTTNPFPIPNPIPASTTPYTIGLKVWSTGTEPTNMICTKDITKLPIPTASISKILPQ
jgi:hypothetical protein